MRVHFFTKLALIALVTLLTFSYALYEKNKYYGATDSAAQEPTLKKLPEFNTLDVASGSVVRSYDYLKGNRGLFVHIWGTWCAPCEKEMPEFLKYAQSVEGKGIKFLLVAVNDEEMKIKKFMSRFVLPKNVLVVLDKENKVMDSFGTLKVPETFLFDSTGKHINKFIGPQEWQQESYQTRLDFWLGAQNDQNYVDRKIETH